MNFMCKLLIRQSRYSSSVTPLLSCQIKNVYGCCFSSSNPTVRLKQDILRVFDSDGRSMGHKTRKEAEEMAKKRGLFLSPMPIKGKPKYPEYQLKAIHEIDTMKEASDEKTGEEEEIDQDSDNDSKASSKRRDIKRIVFAYNIDDGDLKFKIMKINQLINKLHTVKVTVTGGPGKKLVLQEILSKVKSSLRPEAKIIFTILKDDSLKFTVDLDSRKTSPIEKIEIHDETDKFTIDPKNLFDDGKIAEIIGKKPKNKDS